MDIPGHIAAIGRAVDAAPESDGVSVRLTRRYPATPEDVWDAITDPERLRRWFLPISGDLRVGGAFQLEGNAGGEILACEPPSMMRVTFGGDTSIVEVRLSADGDQTQFELVHTVPLEMAGGPGGALYVDPGWDGALLGLALYFAGEMAPDPVAAANSLESQEFSLKSAHAWADVVEATGQVTKEDLAAALDASLRQFAPDLYQP